MRKPLVSGQGGALPETTVRLPAGTNPRSALLHTDIPGISDIPADQDLDPVVAQRRPRATRRRREKMFGLGRPRALDRNAKVRIMHWARCLSRRIEKGRAYGVVTAKTLAVLEALLWAFHNAKSGLCFPSYETIAEAAHCARSTVAEAIKALEEAGIMSWVHRLKRVRVACVDLFGVDGVRVVPQRTSNAYHFFDPGGASLPRSEKPTETPNQGFISSLSAAFGGERAARPERKRLFEEG